MLQLNNKTPFTANIMLIPNEQGIDTLYIMAKATFTMASQLTLVKPQVKLQGDEYWGDPEESSLKYATDYHLGKIASDIVMLGQAYAPAEKPVRQLDVHLTVGKINKTVRIYGDRVWLDSGISQAQAFTTMPLIYERSYGGQHVQDGEVQSADVRNPLGRGYIGQRQAKQMQGASLPNLENPRQLISRPKDQPEPTGFAFIDPSWPARSKYAGSYNEEWSANKAPYLPDDFDKKFFNAAPEDLIYPGFLQGGEPVSISNMHPSGKIQFNVPTIKLVSKVNIANTVYQPKFVMETLLLQPNQLQFSMVWRTSITCDKRVLKIKEVSIGLSK